VPTYSYECGSCGHVQDVFHGMSAEPKVMCDPCGKKCKRLMGTGAGFIFKGTGFYETDYKDKKGTPPEKPKADGTSMSTTESKPEAKSEKKAEPKPPAEKAKTSSAKKKAANS
jgi:putative FmdB family regulatory protein